MIDNQLLLLSKNDIPFISAQMSIHQPTLKEIAFVGEDSFFTGVQFLNFSKDRLDEEDKKGLENKTDFEILMLIAQDENPLSRKNKVCAEMVLSLLFPEYTIHFMPSMIALSKDGENHIINNENFQEFKDIIYEMFCMDQLNGGATQEYNPANKAAEKLVEKFKKRHEKLAKAKGSGQKVTILSRYVSILAVGEQKDINSLLNYSVYQLFDEFERFNLKSQSDIYIQAKMAGAKDLKDVENWMKDIHSTSDDE